MGVFTKHIKETSGLDQVAQISASFKILSDPTRLKILCLLFDNKDGLCVYEIAEHVGISQSAASHQLSKLESRGIVESFREGQMVCYAISKNDLTKNLERVTRIFKR